MRIFVELDNGLLPDRFGKHAPEAYQLDGHPVRSFPIEIADVPEGARSLALTRTPAPRASWLAYRARTAIGRLWQAAIPTRASSIVTRARTRLTRRTTTR